MEGRLKRLLTGGLLVGLMGCGHLRDKKPTGVMPQGSTPEPPISISKKPEEKENKGPIKVETLVAFANVRLQAAQTGERSDRDREKLYQDARTAYQQVLQRDAKNLDAMLGMARIHRGLNEKDLCVEWYQKAIKASPNNAAVWGEMGQSLDGLQDRDAAINCYHTATKMDPTNKDYRKALGFALARAGRYEEGVAWLSRCMSPADAHVCVGRMMDHNGQHVQATQQFAAALKIDPNNETARLAINNLSPPTERIPDASVIQTVAYEQPAPIVNVPAPSYQKPIMVEGRSNPTPAPQIAPAVPMRASDPVPTFMNRSGSPSTAPAPVQGWSPAR